jgi:asparagine synthase (glutamine-hydrolysing)
MSYVTPMNILARTVRSLRPLVSDPALYSMIRAVRRQKLTYLSRLALLDLCDAAQQLDRKNLHGLIIEAGVALGGSAIILAKTKAPARPLHLYDVFGMIPPPSTGDGPDAHARYIEIASGRAIGIKGSRYYGYETGLLEKVQRNFVQFGIDLEQTHTHVWPGLFEDTLQVNQPVALAHIDCDWYDSVWLCLERITPHLIRGGVLVVDDYWDWQGCKRAVDEYFAGRSDEFRFVTRARLHIERRA